MVEIFFVEEGNNVGVATIELAGRLLPSFLAMTSVGSLLETISTAALDSGFASMTALDDAAAAATATAGGDGVGRCAATSRPPPPRLPLEGAFPNDPAASVGEASLVELGGETSFILLSVGFAAGDDVGCWWQKLLLLLWKAAEVVMFRDTLNLTQM